MPAYLGHVQLAIITRLAKQDQTTATLADIASSSVIGASLSILAKKGFARVTGKTPAAGGSGGRPRDVWSITKAGRRALAKVTVTT